MTALGSPKVFVHRVAAFLGIGLIGIIGGLSFVWSAGGHAYAQTDGWFDAYFVDKTMRVDYFHAGGLETETVALDQIVSDGSWAGSRTRLIDDLNLGKYLFEVIDRRTNRTLYSRGFASIYGEWETTAEYRARYRTFHESLRFPWPRAPVQVVLKVRDPENGFQQIWSTVIDPDSRFANPADRAPMGEVWPIVESGPPSEKVDVVVIGEGYATSELSKFHRDADATRGRPVRGRTVQEPTV